MNWARLSTPYRVGAQSAVGQLTSQGGITLPVSTVTPQANEASKFLPACEMRVATDSPTTYYCRHDRVRALDHRVTSEICESCTVRELPCVQARTEAAPPISPRRPSIIRNGLNAARALGEFVGDRGRLVSDLEYETRLAVCETCDQKRGNKCAHCGCQLKLKARGRVFKCPLEKWPNLPDASDG